MTAIETKAAGMATTDVIAASTAKRRAANPRLGTVHFHFHRASGPDWMFWNGRFGQLVSRCADDCKLQAEIYIYLFSCNYCTSIS